MNNVMHLFIACYQLETSYVSNHYFDLNNDLGSINNTVQFNITVKYLRFLMHADSQ